MKICIISTYPPINCGIGYYTAELCHSLISINHKIEIVIFTYKIAKKSSIQKENNITIIRVVPQRGLPYEIMNYLSFIKPDILQIHSAPGMFSKIFYLYLSFLNNFPIVTTIHETCSFTLRNLPTALPFKLLYEKSKRLIVHSKIARSLLVNRYKILTNKIIYTHLGVNISKFNPEISGNMFKNKFKLNNNFTILFFGLFRPSKGIEVLINAFNNIKRSIKNVKLILAGDDPFFMKKGFANDGYRNYLKNLVHKYSVDNDVIFTGHISDNEIPECLASADLIVLPYFSSFQSSILYMALAMGKPVITSKIDSFAGTIENGRNGLLFSPGNIAELSEMIIHLYKDTNAAKNLATNARIFSEKSLDLKKVANLYQNIYESMLK